MTPEPRVSISQRLLRTPSLTAAWTAIVLLALLAICYSDSFQSSWHYDDANNIVQNPKVHMDQWSWVQVKQTLSAGLSFQTISRPLAFASFALNYRLGRLDVWGFHVVNLGIHWVAAVFLFLFIRATLKLPALKTRTDRYATMIALIAAALWATHPIQVTAVTYIVQRMASMAGMFYIMAMYLYLRGRTASSPRTRTVYFSLGAGSAVCALLTKENTVMIGYAILLYDLMLIQGISKNSIRRALLSATIPTLLLVTAGFLYMYPDVKGFTDSFNIRPFTMGQRLLTQPRVLFFYLSLIAVPMTSRMSLIHDFATSLSLVSPWTTWTALAGLLLCIVILVSMARRYPLLSYCGLFFFLNHAIEGSILNLEMVYEHRNYLPSMLLFVPISVAALKCVSFFNYKPSIQRMIVGLVVIIFISQMDTTYRYNKVFKTELSLWSDVVVRYPEASAGHLNLGCVYWASGLYDRAFRQFNTALELNHFSNKYQKGSAYYNLGLYESGIRNDFNKAQIFFDNSQAIIKDPGLWKKIAQNWMELGNYKPALRVLEDAVDRWGDSLEFSRMMSISYLKDFQYANAAIAARKVLAEDPDDPLAIMVMAQSQRFLCNEDLALQYLSKLGDKIPDNSILLLSLSEIYAEIGMLDLADVFLCQLMRHKGLSDVPIGEIVLKNHNVMPYVPGKWILSRLRHFAYESCSQ